MNNDKQKLMHWSSFVALTALLFFFQENIDFKNHGTNLLFLVSTLLVFSAYNISGLHKQGAPIIWGLTSCILYYQLGFFAANVLLLLMALLAGIRGYLQPKDKTEERSFSRKYLPIASAATILIAVIILKWELAKVLFGFQIQYIYSLPQESYYLLLFIFTVAIGTQIYKRRCK